MQKFKPIYERAAKRKGGEAALIKLLPKPKSKAALKKIPDDRWLSAMTSQIFKSGFVWKVIDNKWPNFEKAFHDFDPHELVMQSDENLEALMKDESIVRNWAKIKAVRGNAQFVVDIAEEHGSFGKFVADWPETDIVDLLELMKKRGERLGGNTGRYILRIMGKNCFMISNDVTAALIRSKVVDKEPTSKSALAKVQAAFNQWSEESGLGLSQISRVLACSIG